MAMRERKMTCAVCNREWKAKYPEEAKALECPDCGYFNPLPWEAQQDEGWQDSA